MKNQICNKCEGTIVMRAMQEKVCKKCNKEFWATSIPGEVMCSDCKKIHSNLCILCGEEIEKNN